MRDALLGWVFDRLVNPLLRAPSLLHARSALPGVVVRASSIQTASTGAPSAPSASVLRVPPLPHGEQQKSKQEQELSSSAPTPDIPAGTEWDAIIVGGGHNGLVSAAYLAKQGLKVLLLERRYILGGAAVTEEIHPGFHYSRGSYLFSLFRPQIVRDLDLKRHGLKFLFRDPSSFTPMRDGRYLMMGPNMEFNQQQIAKFSKRDAQRYPEYDEHLTRLTSFFEPYLDAPPPGPSLTWAERMHQLRTAGKLVKNAVRLGREVLDFHEILTAPASRILDRWFESEPLKSTLATDAVIGAMTSPSTPGSGYVLFHHVMGEVDGSKGAWTYVQGGMGAVSQAIASAAREAGASLHTNARVDRILVEGDRACGVVLSDGRQLRSRVVLSNATPNVTFQQLLGSSEVPSEFRQHVEHLDYTSPVCKINLSMDRLPNFLACPHEGNEAGPQHRGTIHFVEDSAQLEGAYRDAQNGRPSARPVIEMTIPSVLDNTLAPPGKHVASLFVQYAPYSIPGGWTREAREQFAAAAFGVIEQYCPGFTASLLHYEVLAPPDLEKVFGLTGGNIFHHQMGLNDLFWLRGTPFGHPRTPVKGLYMCGAGIHPGGGVMGTPGRNAARAVGYDWDDIKKQTVGRKHG